MKKRLLMFLLVGGLMITSAISLSSCKKNNEANEDLSSLPVVETTLDVDRDYGFYCPADLYLCHVLSSLVAMCHGLFPSAPNWARRARQLTIFSLRSWGMKK